MDLSSPLVAGLLGRCEFPPSGSEAVCGVSGGADSLALMVLAVEAGVQVTAVHVDHGLRPTSSQEAEVVREAALQFGAGFRAEAVDVGQGPDLEARARRARHALLGSDAMTGHTADDQAETVLINLIRGAGARGLGAMRPGPTKPILGLRRSETHELCDSLGLKPVADESNDDLRFQRNHLRAEVIPLLDKIARRDVVPLITRSSSHLRELDDYISAVASSLDPTDTRSLMKAPEILARYALRTWLTADGYAPSEADTDRVWGVVCHRSVGCEISGGRRIRRSGGILSVEKG